MIVRDRVRKTVSINVIDIHALFDTGSDITAISEKAVKKFNIEFKANTESIKGIGGYSILKGSFPAKIQIENDCFDVQCFVLCENQIEEDLIVGLDLIEQGSMNI